MNDQLLLIESNITENNTKQAFREVTFYKEGFKPRTDLCKDKQGKIISDNAAIKNRWKEHFQQLLRSKVNNSHYNPQDALQTDDGIQVEPSTLNEIKEAIKMQKPHKAPGKDGILAELLKQGGESLMQTLHRLICKIWNEEEMPCDWE
jgi:hypothetical protein